MLGKIEAGGEGDDRGGDGWIMVESSDKTWSTGEGNDMSLQYSCLDNPMKHEKAKI